MYLLFYLCFLFISYSFIGWIIEEVYSFFCTGAFKKEGFLKGPIKPMYGIAMTILIVYHDIFKIKGILFIIFCFLIPTIVEYISGYLLKHIFNKVYWDYSDLKYNISGYITLIFSCYWCILSYIGVKYLNPILVSKYIFHMKLINIFTTVMMLSFMVDLIIVLNNYYTGKRNKTISK